MKYDYSFIKGFFKEWAKFKRIDITEDDAVILSFYAQEHHKTENNGETIFEDYIETKVEFQWENLPEEDGKFLVMVWNTYIHIIERDLMYHYVSNEGNYKDIYKLLTGKNRY